MWPKAASGTPKAPSAGPSHRIPGIHNPTARLFQVYRKLGMTEEAHRTRHV